jgi:hypothetical protein
MAFFGDDYRGLNDAERVFGTIFWPSVYFAGYAATASAALSFATVSFAFLSLPIYFHARSLPVFWIFAFATLASRTGKKRYWVAAGALLPIALCWAVDFSAYGAAIAAAALWISRGNRLHNASRFLLGVAAVALAIFLVLGGMGVLGAFLSTTFGLLPTLPPVYALPLERPTLPPASTWSALLAYIRDRTTFVYCTASVGSLIVAASVVRAPVVGSRGRQTVPAFAYILASMLSVIERRHINYPYFFVPVAVVNGVHWLAGLRRSATLRNAAAAVIAVIAVCACRPLATLSAVGASLRDEPRRAGFEELASPPRARGAVFTAADARLVRATEEFLSAARLAPDETWLDFANVPGLYYLFNRDCPIRFYEVPYYESEWAQEEVIQTVERNPRVRAVLIRDGLPSQPMDGIANAQRAPLVARYLGQRFEPFYESNGVEFWLRR